MTEPTIHDADTGDLIGPASPAHIAAGRTAEAKDGGAGLFLVDAELRQVAAGTWAADQPGVRRVYVLGDARRRFGS
jgi:hypothetical protein